MIRLLAPYLAGALLAALAGLGGWAWHLAAERDRLAARAASLTLMLKGCNGRVAQILEDKERDHAVDQVPDADLGGAVPRRWILPAE